MRRVNSRERPGTGYQSERAARAVYCADAIQAEAVVTLPALWASSGAGGCGGRADVYPRGVGVGVGRGCGVSRVRGGEEV